MVHSGSGFRSSGAINLEESDLEELKRTDLSEQKLNFEIVHSDLLVVYRLLREILTSPTEWFIGLSNDNIQRLGTYLREFYEIVDTIWNVNSSTSEDAHKKALRRIFQFCDRVKGQLGQIVTYLRAKKAEQLDLQAVEQLKPLVHDIAVEMLDNFEKENNLSHESTKQGIAETEKRLDQLSTKVENEIAKESVSKHRAIFARQAEEHQRTSRRWLIATGLLIVVFGAVFYWLFESLKLGGTELIGVLQNVFTKGFLLTLIYFILNRSVKNYAAQKHLEIVNRHRQNALDTFNEFLEASGDNQETRDAVLLAATNAIFDANQSGYLSAKMKGSESTNPFQQVFKAVMPDSSTKSD